MRVLSVAYPFAAVGQDAAGGAEQVLWAIDRALVAAGHGSTVIACDGSQVSGTLLAVPASSGVIDEASREAVHRAVRAAIASAIGQADIVHLHGVDFADILPPPGPPVLATLHLPPAWYTPQARMPRRPRTWIHAVSTSQHAALLDLLADSAHVLPPIANGVAVDALGATHRPCRGYAACLGRICPEKGQHLALAAAHRAGVTLLLAGPVFGYPEHVAYFEQQVRPLLDRRRRSLGPVGFAQKRRLLASALCLLVPSLAEETSSLVAMEAAACGTPVIAFRRGALPQIVEPGVTGLLVDDADAMASAIGEIGEIDRAGCRAAAAARFDVGRMTASYLALYERLADPAVA